MPKVKSIKSLGREDVYNMEVENTHNFAINGGLIVHNCDGLRYYAVQWIRAAEPPQEQKRRYTAGQLQDYYTADEETRKLIIKKWGYPIL